MALSDLSIYQEFAYEGMIETLDQQIALFNTASQNTIILSSGDHQGDYDETSMFKLLSGLIIDRDPTDTAGTVGKKSLQHIKERSVKMGLGTPMIDLSPGQFAWINIDPKAAGAAAGQAIAKGLLQEYLNRALGVCRAVFNANPNTLYDASAVGAGTMVPVNYVRGAGKFGDRSNAIELWVTHSTPMFDLWANNMTNSQMLFQYGNVAIVRDPFGRLILVTDSPDLVVTGTPNTYHTLGLTENAVVIEQNNDLTMNIDTRNGGTNIQRTMQSEWSANISLKGYAFASNIPHPTVAQLKTAANWTQYVTSIKDTAGVTIKTK